ncbi:methyltransferase domain-containing protein [Candidatus Micrarchaeota archaeon]|nr:methyltransferase domain-containing protein [Candidatus Micrarchaeota archaeon]
MEFVCPKCKVPLGGKDKFVCSKCASVYPVKEKIPDFLDSKSWTTAIHTFLFDTLSLIYENNLYEYNFKLWCGMSVPKRDVLRKMIRKEISQDARNIIDIAGGSGTLSRHLASDASDVYCIDYSMGMLRSGQKHSKAPNMHFIRSMAETLPFAKQSFDGAIIGYSFYLFKKPEIVLREVSRVLKPGAPLAIATFFKGDGGYLKYRLGIWHAKRKGINVYTLAQTRAMVSKAGFDEIDTDIYGSFVLLSARKKKDK